MSLYDLRLDLWPSGDVDGAEWTENKTKGMLIKHWTVHSEYIRAVEESRLLPKRYVQRGTISRVSCAERSSCPSPLGSLITSVSNRKIEDGKSRSLQMFRTDSGTEEASRSEGTYVLSYRGSITCTFFFFFLLLQPYAVQISSGFPSILGFSALR